MIKPSGRWKVAESEFRYGLGRNRLVDGRLERDVYKGRDPLENWRPFEDYLVAAVTSHAKMAQRR